jgi:putative endonuclease
MEGAYVYILRCRDGSFYVGTTRKELEARVAEHNSGILGGYTALRRPVVLVFAEWFEKVTDAIQAERQIKGWSRAKKEALIRGDWQTIQSLSKRRRPYKSGATPSFETPATRAPQDEVD